MMNLWSNGWLAVCALALAGIAIARDVRFPDIPEQPGPSRDLALERIAAGGAVVAALPITSAERPGGELLDPRTIRVRVGESDADWRLHWRLPHLPLLAILPRDAEAATTRTLTIEAMLFPTARKVRGSLEIPPAAGKAGADFPVFAVHGEDGRPVADALVFGQAAEGLLTRTDGKGHAPLVQFARGQREPHAVWAAGYWTTLADPRTSPTVTLRRVAPIDAEASVAAGAAASLSLAGGPSQATPVPRVRIEVQDARGAIIAPAAIEVGERYWLAAPLGTVSNVPVPIGARVVAVAPGYRAGFAEFTGGDTLRIVVVSLN